MTDSISVRRGRHLLVAAAVGLVLLGIGLVTAFVVTQDPAPSAVESASTVEPSAQPSDPLTTAPRPAQSTPDASAPDSPQPTEPPLTLPEAAPVGLRIPSLDVDAPMVDLGLLPDRTLEVPTTAADVGWYETSPTPGEQGPSIVAGHVTYNGPGVFLRLGELGPGDVVEVDRADGSTAVFEVTEVGEYDKDEFPTVDVYGSTDHAGLRLITCGGAFNPDIGYYDSNVIAFAELVSSA